MLLCMVWFYPVIYRKKQLLTFKEGGGREE